MSLMPEFIFRAVIHRGMRTFREDTRFISQLFRNLEQETVEQLRRFILEKRIYVDINYPRDPLQLPAIIILLRQETEAQAYLGDSMGVDSIPEEFTYDTHEDSEFASDILGGAGTLTTSDGYGELVYGPARVLSATANTIRVSDLAWKPDQYLVGGHQINILGGTGVGQQRLISSNTQNTITVSVNWDTIPDSTSVFEIREVTPGDGIGEPMSLYTREGATAVERLGSLYQYSYQIQVITENQELTVFLHAILKAIFTLSRQFMERQGIINMKLGGTDFVPRAEYQPSLAYMRALDVSFVYPFDIFNTLSGLAENFQVTLENCDIDGVVVDLSTTTIP